MEKPSMITVCPNHKYTATKSNMNSYAGVPTVMHSQQGPISLTRISMQNRNKSSMTLCMLYNINFPYECSSMEKLDEARHTWFKLYAIVSVPFPLSSCQQLLLLLQPTIIKVDVQLILLSRSVLIQSFNKSLILSKCL